MATMQISPQLVLDEEHKIWKKNATYLYDTIGSYELEWPSLTVAWFPDKVLEENKNYSTHRLLLGTHTSGGAQNSVIIGQVKLPKEHLQPEEKFYSEENGEYGGFGQGGSIGKFEVSQRINHPSEVNRARFMPQNPEIIATKTGSPEVLVFDRTKHPSVAPKDGGSRPEMTLAGHHEEGYGLSWNCFQEGHLLSGADDGLICHWNVNRQREKAATPSHIFRGHEGVVEDVAWHLKNAHFFASASDDQTVRFWDSRQPEPSSVIRGHRSEVNAVAFSPHQEFFLLSGSKDKTVGLWDLRNPKVRLHMLEGHEDSIFRVEWAPFDASIVASCGADRRVILWDLSRIGQEQSPEDAADGPPELVFCHGGHTDKTSDFGFCPNCPWTAVSVADDNVMQVWTVSDAVHSGDPTVDEDDLE